MAIRIVRLGSERIPNEGLRIGTVRRPPRGVPKSKFASGNWYDVWLPNLAPSPETVKMALTAENQRQWAAFVSGIAARWQVPEQPSPRFTGRAFASGGFFGGLLL